MVKAGESLYAAASNISEALNECTETTRRSTISVFRSFKQGSSIGPLAHSVLEEETDDKCGEAVR